MSKKLALFLATSGHSGVDRVMKNLLKEFSRRGIPVDLVRIKDHGPHIDPGLEWVNIIELPASHVNSALPGLIRYLKSSRPHAMLTDKDRVNRVALWARRIARVPTKLVIRVGTTVSENLARRGLIHRTMQYYSIRHFYPWADAIVVPSHGAARDLAEIGKFSDDFISVVPSPIINEEIEQQAAEPLDNPWLEKGSPPVVLGAGELCARKDFATLIRAFAIVREQRNCRLIVLGKGRKKHELMDLASQLGIAHDVLFPGFVSNPYSYMKRASVFVLSSRCEGAPVVLMEALGLGTPVVSTDCPSGPREILMDGKFGPLVPVADPRAMAGAILSVLDNPIKSELLKQAAQRFTVKQSADRYLSVLGI